jgi:rare lipoprotein A
MNTFAAMWVVSIGSTIFSATFYNNTSIFLDRVTSTPISYINQVIASNREPFLSLNLVAKRAHTVSLRSTGNHWTIFVNERKILTLKNIPEAAALAAKLEFLLNSPNFEPDGILPKIQNGIYVGQYDSEVLFTVPVVGIANPDLNLTQWVNNLRKATGAAPLTLVESQLQMYGLATTDQNLQGEASWYGRDFHGLPTASGEAFEQKNFTAAHPSLPLGTYLKVTNLRNGKSLIVRVNDRGPYVGNRILDLSHAAAIEIDSEKLGVVEIKATVMAQRS